MQEFSSVSASSYDPAALAAKLTEKSAEGWAVVSIVPTGGDITAFLSRGAQAAAPAEVAAVVVEPEPAPAPEPVATPEPVMPEPAPAAVAEAPGWAVAPEPAAPAAAPMAPIAEPTPSYQPQAYQPAAQPQAYQPAAQPQAYQPAPAQAAPAVPADWYADPSGRYELRYWDGNAWTEYVSRGGQTFTDPPVAS